MEQTNNNPIDDVKREGKRAVRKVARHPWIEPLMRLGFIARGVVYGLVGLLAIQVAVGGQGRFTDQQGAIATIGAQPFGKALLILIAVGMVGYALWGLIRAVLDPLRKGSDTKGMIERAGYLVSAISYAGLFIPTLRLVLGQSGSAGEGGSAQQQAVSGILTEPFGPLLVGLIGAAIGGAGISQIIKGWKANFDLEFEPYEMTAGRRRWANRLGRFGYVARGITFAISGWFLIQAARTANPEQARGIDGALRELAMQPYGPVLLGLVAAGLIAFGVYSIAGGVWFRFKK